MEYAVETISLTKIFSDWWGRAKVYAVDDLNLQVRTNEVFGLLGPNGSGKTTTLKMLLGLLYPTKGKALVLGGSGADPKVNKRIGFLPEESYLYRFLSARETLDFYGRLFGLPRPVRRDRIEALLDMVGLKAVASRPVGTYSKGMARRIGLAQALINDPDLLILDEPTTGLDPIGTRQIKDLILKLAERGKTVLLCSHLLADVEDVCDRIAILYGGKVQALGQVRDLLQQADKRQIVTDAVGPGTIERIKRILEQENAHCEVDSPMERLETYFVRTVTEAQRQARPTSGAVSTTDIGAFLTEKSPTETVIEKLTSAQVSGPPEPGPQPTDRLQTEQVTEAAEREPEPDKDLLEQLTKSGASERTEQVRPVDAPGTTPVEAPEQTPAERKQAGKSILDELVGDEPGDRDRNKPEEGAAGDA